MQIITKYKKYRPLTIARRPKYANSPSAESVVIIGVLVVVVLLVVSVVVLGILELVVDISESDAVA